MRLEVFARQTAAVDSQFVVVHQIEVAAESVAGSIEMTIDFEAGWFLPSAT
jgi:hypothetical protein